MASFNKEVGFTLIELMVVILIISILAAVAITQYTNYRVRAYDATARLNLKNAMSALENYFVDNESYPSDYNDLLANGFNFSKDVCFTKYKLENSGKRVHVHIMHTSSPNAWHTEYPDDAGDVDHRNAASCI